MRERTVFARISMTSEFVPVFRQRAIPELPEFKRAPPDPEEWDLWDLCDLWDLWDGGARDSKDAMRDGVPGVP